MPTCERKQPGSGEVSRVPRAQSHMALTNQKASFDGTSTPKIPNDYVNYCWKQDETSLDNFGGYILREFMIDPIIPIHRESFGSIWFDPSNFNMFTTFYTSAISRKRVKTASKLDCHSNLFSSHAS